MLNTSTVIVLRCDDLWLAIQKHFQTLDMENSWYVMQKFPLALGPAMELKLDFPKQ